MSKTLSHDTRYIFDPFEVGSIQLRVDTLGVNPIRSAIAFNRRNSSIIQEYERRQEALESRRSTAVWGSLIRGRRRIFGRERKNTATASVRREWAFNGRPCRKLNKARYHRKRKHA